jgi:NAD-dependent DNA ligase
VFCITGTLSSVRADVVARIAAAGGRVADKFNKSVTHLVTGSGAKGSTKSSQARKQGCTVIDEDALNKLLEVHHAHRCVL